MSTETIYYTTEISSQIRDAYKAYKAAKDRYLSGSPHINAAYLVFAKACEKDGKSPISVIKSLK